MGRPSLLGLDVPPIFGGNPVFKAVFHPRRVGRAWTPTVVMVFHSAAKWQKSNVFSCGSIGGRATVSFSLLESYVKFALIGKGPLVGGGPGD